METEDSAPYVENHPVDSDILEGCHVKMPSALIVVHLNVIAYCGSIFPERPIFLTAPKKNATHCTRTLSRTKIQKMAC